MEARGLRILCDPLLGDTLHGGIHVVHPPRIVHADALRPDLLVISHAHPDHFDVPSLAQLARLHPELPVLTADALVAETALRLGFRSASVLAPWEALTLGQVTLLTTPSVGVLREWGIAVHDPSGTAWNQVDSVLDARAVRAVREALGKSVGTDEIALGVVHWSPLREVEAVTGGSLGFPFQQWADKLAAIAALEAPAVVPAAAGFLHSPPFTWRDAHVFPVTERALARDLSLLAPGSRVVSCPPGSSLALEAGQAPQLQAGSDLATPLPSEQAPAWAPLSMPEVVDPALGGETCEGIRQEIHPWLQGALVEAIARQVRALSLPRPLRLSLQVVLPGDQEFHLFEADAARVTHTRPERLDPDHDAAVVVAGSMLADVIGGRRHWGEPLLAGLLRGARRLAVLPAFFPYWALSYRDSVGRWVDWQVRQHQRR